MSRTTSIKTVILPTKGNQDIFAAGQSYFTTPTSYTSRDSTLAVLPGQVIFYSPDLKLSIDEGTSRSTYRTVRVGVGVDLNGDGETDFIRWAGEFSKCGLREHAAEHAACGVGTIADLLFNNCNLECGKAYGFQIQVFTPHSIAFDSPFMGATYDFVYTPPCPDCDNGDCSDTTVSPDQVMCGLYNVITGNRVDPNWNIKLNNFPITQNQHEYEFDVAQLYKPADADDETVFEYCFTEVDGTCDTCEYMSVTAANLPTQLSSTLGTLDTEAITSYYTEISEGVFKVTRAGFKRLAAEITRILDGKGKAVYLEPTGNCCTNHKIEVTTCLTDFLLQNAAVGTLTPCGSSNPFADVTVYNQCQDCANTNSTNTFVAGLRFYSKQYTGECDCIAGNKALVEYYTELEVFPAHGFTADSGAVVLYKQTSTLPKNQGFQWQPAELHSIRDAFEEWVVYENWEGKYGVPAENDILNHVVSDCKEAYCVMTGQFDVTHTEIPSGHPVVQGITVQILIPEGEDTAGDAIADAWNFIFADDCGPVGTITCVD